MVAAKTILKLDQIEKTYGTPANPLCVLHGIDLRVEESHPGANPKPDVQVFLASGFHTALITWRRFSAYGTPGKESGGSISS